MPVMKRAVLFAAIVAQSFPAGLAAARTHKITVDIHWTPEGAQVLTGEIPGPNAVVPRLMGVTPLALNYTITGDCGRTEAVRVRWASGAETSVPCDDKK